jgi:hypothetical protein
MCIGFAGEETNINPITVCAKALKNALKLQASVF